MPLMNNPEFPQKAEEILLHDAMQRDRTTARRVCILRLLCQECFLTREHLVARLEGELGKGCFGDSAWEDNFYRDMRVVKLALKAAGYHLRYQRSLNRPGYYLEGQPILGSNLAGILNGSVAEVDPAQITIYKRLSPAEHFRQGCSISDTALRVVAYRIHNRNTQLSLEEAQRLALQKGAQT